jgi:hypothetical protein
MSVVTGTAGGRRDRHGRPPEAVSLITEGIEGLSRARNQGHRCLPTKAGRSEQWRNPAPSLGDLSMGRWFRGAMPLLRLAPGETSCRA